MRHTGNIKIEFTFSELNVETPNISGASNCFSQSSNGYSVTWPLQPHDTSWRRIWGISWPLSLFTAGLLSWMANASITFLTFKVTIFSHYNFHISQLLLMDCIGGMFYDGRVGMLTISVFVEPHPQCPSCFTNVLLTPTTLHTVVVYTSHTVSLSGSYSWLTNGNLRVLKGLW